MTIKFRTVKGVSVSNIKGIHEAFCKTERGFLVNVSAENILTFIFEFLEMQNDMMFFVLELPCTRDEESKLRKDDRAPFHKNIYYLDWLGVQAAKDLLIKYGDILINDGMSGFGFGTPHGETEIFVSPYKIINLFVSNPSDYLSIFKKMGIIQEDRIVTMRSRIDQDHPGTLTLYKKGLDDVYKVCEDLRVNGLYFGKTVESY